MEQKAADQLSKTLFLDFKGAGELYCDLLKKHLRKNDKILNAGCGDQALAKPYLDNVNEVVGIDKIEPERVPSYIDQFVRADLIRLPLPDNYFDVIIAEWVLEHLQKPKIVLDEFKRILKPGGKIIFMTTNINSFLGVVSLLTPTFVHSTLKKICLGISKKDTFPTKYKINTVNRIEKMFSDSGYQKLSLKTADALGYWRFSRTLLKIATKIAKRKHKKNKKKHRFHIVGAYGLK